MRKGVVEMSMFLSPIKSSIQDAASGGPGYMGRDERKAKKQAEAAERVFRETKGYEPDNFLARLKRKLTRK